MEEVEQQPKPKGRPPGTPGANQFTGKKAQNIEFVRRFLREHLDAVRGQPLNRITFLACRLLLACEGVFMFKPSDPLTWQKTHKKLTDLGQGIHAGQVSLPQLLDELEDMELEA